MQSNRLPPIVGLNPVSEAGFPDKVCPVIFLPGCNFKCPYCMNAAAVKWNKPAKYTPQEVLKYLQDNDEPDLLISGGEPCIHHGLENLISFFASEGIKVRLSTNGSNPEMLADLLADQAVEFVAMDIKVNPLLPNSHPNFAVVSGDPDIAVNIRSSIFMLNGYVNTGADWLTVEYRTTLYPDIVNSEDVEVISSMIPAKIQYVLQQFRHARKMLDDGARNVAPYSDDKVKEILANARVHHEKTDVRWP